MVRIDRNRAASSMGVADSVRAAGGFCRPYQRLSRKLLFLRAGAGRKEAPCLS